MVMMDVQTAKPLENPAPLGAQSGQELPIVVVGNGPVGMRVVRELRRCLPGVRIIVYGDEPYRPYDRVQLSSWLAGDLHWSSLLEPPEDADLSDVEQRIGYRVCRIDPIQKVVIDTTGGVQPFSHLVLATGSRAHVPNIPGIHLPGVYTFRNLDDATALLARRARSHHTVVLGGGLLGLEAARGMLQMGTKVTVIDHADRLMASQLDEQGSAYLQYELTRQGIGILLGSGASRICGNERLTGLVLRDGTELLCDTLIVAAGIRPNVELARDARLAFRRGIVVDDSMRTSDPDIYAVGECAEHRERIYGLVAPGLEQAAVAAAHISGTQGQYRGSIAASRLKVVGTPVFSMGPVGVDARRHYGLTYTYRDPAKGIYRKILVHRHRLVGALGVGEWPETSRLQGYIARRGWVRPWQIMRFRRTGMLWPEGESSGVAAWPATAIVCQCTGATQGAICEARDAGAGTVTAISEATGAGSVCGSCRPLVQELIGDSRAEPLAQAKTLTWAGLLALVVGLLFVLLPPIPYADSVQTAWSIDQLWRDGMLKQVTGYSVLGAFAIGLLMSLRKRAPGLFSVGSYDLWRLMHLILGLVVLFGLVLHTGLRLGHGLNAMLAGSFVAMLIVGGVAAVFLGQQHRLEAATARRARTAAVWAHILLFWPVPALLGWHVLKVYWF